MSNNNVYLNELPSFYRKIREFQELSNTVEISWNEIDEAFLNMENDQFILTSGEDAIALREKDFGIAADIHIETLEFRQLRLLTRMQENTNLVYEYLKNILDSMLGKDKYEIDLDIDAFKMDVFVTPETLLYKEVKSLVERIVPLNIDLRTARKFNLNTNLFMPSYLATGTEITLHPMAIDNLETNTQSNSLVGVKTASTITLTPF